AEGADLFDDADVGGSWMIGEDRRQVADDLAPAGDLAAVEPDQLAIRRKHRRHRLGIAPVPALQQPLVEQADFGFLRDRDRSRCGLVRRQVGTSGGRVSTEYDAAKVPAMACW